MQLIQLFETRHGLGTKELKPNNSLKTWLGPNYKDLTLDLENVICEQILET